MKFNKRATAVAAAIAAGSLALAGCSSSGDVNADGVTEITVWHYWDGMNADTFDAMAREFNEAQSDVKVTTSTVPNAEFLTKLRASATSDTLPDIAIGDLIWVPQIAQMDRSADLGNLLSDATLSDINPALTRYGAIDGKQVSVPVSANNLGLIYNKDLYREAGLDPEEPPTTWDEVLEHGKTIVQETGTPGFELFTQAGADGEGLTWNFQVNLWQAGGDFLNEDNTAAAFNTPQGAQALQYWVDLVESDVARVGQWGAFGSARAAAANDGSWMVGIWAPDPPFDFGTGKAPAPADGQAATNLGGEQAIVFQNGDETERAAGEFLDWFLQPEQVTEWSKATGMLPVLNSVARSDEYTAWVSDSQPLLLPFVEQMTEAHARPNTPLYPRASLAFAQQIERALAGEVSVAEALDNAEQAVNDVLADD